MWETVKLGDICKIVNGSTPLRTNSDYWENGNIPWFTIEDLRKQGRDIQYTKQCITEKALKETSLKLLPEDTVLLCCTASIGATAISRVRMATNQQFNGLIPINGNVIPEYLYYVATTLEQQLLDLSGSATINFIAISKLKKLTIHLPPIAEQRRIVEKLNAIFTESDKAIKLAEEKKIEIEKLKHSLLANELGAKDGNKSVTWETAKLGDICNVRRGTVITKKQAIDGDVPVIAGGIKPPYYHNKANREANCVTISGSGNAGYVSMWNEPIFASDCTTVEPKDKAQLKKFIYYCLLSQQDYIYDNFRSGTAQLHVYAKDIATLDYPILSIAEQESIVDKLDKGFTEIDRIMEITEKQIEQYQALLSVLLASELKGEAA